MKKIEMKVKEIYAAYLVLGEASYSQLSDEDKIKVWKNARLLKPYARQFEEDRNDAQKKLVPDAEFNERLQKAIQYEKAQKEGKESLPMTTEEYQKFAAEYEQNLKLMTEALNEFTEKEVTLEIHQLSEDAFSKLMASNNWTLKQVESIDFMVE